MSTRISPIPVNKNKQYLSFRFKEIVGLDEAELYKELGTLTKSKEKWKESMRCYRCGAMMSAAVGTCPECGFYLNSPVEIQMFEEMMDIRIYDHAKNLLWSGDGTGTAFIDAPQYKMIRICWGYDFEILLRVKNGMAYRCERRLSKMGKRKGDAILVRTRTIPKRSR